MTPAPVTERKIMEDIVDRELREIAVSNPAHRAKPLAAFGTARHLNRKFSDLLFFG
jgi:hypothetical protein